MKRGQLIVIDGNDGSGKATQVALLTKRLKKDGYKVYTTDFPQYENFFGSLIGECLAGKYGDFSKIAPRIASVLYAADRLETAPKINRWLDSGAVVILDRYASANQIHQGGKIHDAIKRREFVRWLDKMEYSVLKIPRPDLIVYLDVPVQVSLKLLEQKLKSKSQRYLKAGQKKDVVESNLKYLSDSYTSAQKIVAELKRCVKVDCASNSDILSREDIAEKVYGVVKKVLIKKHGN